VADSSSRAVDSRTLRTVSAIESAVRQAVTQMPLDELTVAEVCRIAGIGRPSFYTHFASSPELVARMLTAEIDDILPVPAVEHVPTGQLEPWITENLAAALDLVAQDRELYRAAFTSSSSGVLRAVLERAVENRVRNIIVIWQERELVYDVDLAVALPYITGGITRAVEAWAHDDDTDAPARARAIRDLMPRWWPFPS